jgi:hypothetical protein
MKKDLEALALEAVDKYVREHNVGNSLRGHDPNGSPQGLITDPKDLVGIHASTDIIVKDIADVLMKRFPGFRWAIQPNEAGGVFNVFCLDFHAVWGYVIRYDDIMNDPKRRQAVKAAREILARFGYPGVRYDRALMAAIPRNVKGEAIPQLSDMAPTRFTRKAEVEQALATGKARVIGTKGAGHIIEVHR